MTFNFQTYKSKGKLSFEIHYNKFEKFAIEELINFQKRIHKKKSIFVFLWNKPYFFFFWIES